MAFRILLAVPESEALVARQATASLDESDALEFAGLVTEASALGDALDDGRIDVVVLHEYLGPVPTLELAGDLNRRYPDVALVLLAEAHTPELMRGAMFAGVRALVPLPLTLEEFTSSVWNAGEFARSVRERMREDGGQRGRRQARLITFAGAKGGVGTTTVAVLFALHLQAEDPDRSVCFVDLDLQTGDVRAVLDLNHRRSISDLVAVADELTTRHLDEALFAHASGLHVLLPPLEGELGEDVHVAATRRILSALRSRFDVVVVDVGATMTEASAVAVELADVPLLVTQTDVPALRGANRMLALWERLAIRKGDIRVVVNRVHRDSEIQPELCGRVVRADVLKSTIPARFRDLEPIVNTGDPTQLADPIGAAIAALADEVAADRSTEPEGDLTDLEARVARGNAESGQATAEFLAIAPVLALALVLMWQLALFGWGYVMAQNAAREGAAQLAISTQQDSNGDGVYDDVDAAVRNDILRSWGGVEVRQSVDRVRVEVAVPALHPALGRLGKVSSSAGAHLEGEPS